MPQFYDRGERPLHNGFFGLLSVFLILLVTTSCLSSRSTVLNIADTNNFYEDDGICLSSFEMSEGRIIRVKDSQAIGARYINESDLGSKSRDDCFRLCCRTPACNVAVFEEKNSGSCYMFDCGTPEDFRCKFTAQSHYVVAILRRRDILEQRQQLLIQQQQLQQQQFQQQQLQQQQLHQQHNFQSNTQHEAELSQLRTGESDKGMVNGNIGNAAAIVGASKSKQEEESQSSGVAAALRIGTSGLGNGNIMTTTTTAASLTVDVVDNNSQSCSRNQFECKSTRECIAIYNVCDGINQCVDGSDESAELHCPSADPLTNKIQQKSKAPILLPLPLPQGAQQLSSGSTQADTVTNIMAKPSQEDFRLAQSSSSSLQSLGTKNDALKIFNHKEGGILDENYGTQLQQQMHSPYWKSYDYSNVESPNGYGPPMSIPAASSAAGGPNGLYGSNLNMNNNNYGSAPYPYPAYSQQSQQPRPPGGMSQMPLYGNNAPLQQQQYYNNNPNSPLMISNSNNNMMSQNPVYMDPSRFISPNNNGRIQSGLQQPQIQPTTGTTTTVSTTTMKSMTTGRLLSPSAALNQPQNGGAITSALVVPKSDSEKLESTILQRMKNQPFTSETSDVLAEELEAHTAGAGAVFVFLMGVGMSVVMVIIVGCRLRRLGTRRRGKNRLDHDYLVDGMYL